LLRRTSRYVARGGINDDPTDANEQVVETCYWALQDANYNVLGIINWEGTLKERYEYTPYGQRNVYKSAGSNDPLLMSPLMEQVPRERPLLEAFLAFRGRLGRL
jgi:hypothetical protein